MPKVEVCGVKDADPRAYLPAFGSAFVETNRINDEVSRILRSENVDENTVSHSTV